MGTHWYTSVLSLSFRPLNVYCKTVNVTTISDLHKKRKVKLIADATHVSFGSHESRHLKV